MHEVTTFQYQSHEFRSILDGENTLFIAKDVCAALELEDVSRACDKLSADEKLIRKLFVSGQSREMLCVTESGLYRLIFRSNKPEAEKFRRWVFHEVLPSIRKTGSYDIPVQEKKVSVRHTHLRGSMSENGIDVRYSLDLTKIITQPSRQTIELLERITGIPLADIPLESDGGGLNLDEAIESFIEERCELGEEHRESSYQLYSAFRGWYACISSEVAPSITRFSRQLRHRFSKRKSGIIYFIGLRLKKEVAVC